MLDMVKAHLMTTSEAGSLSTASSLQDVRELTEASLGDKPPTREAWVTPSSSLDSSSTLSNTREHARGGASLDSKLKARAKIVPTSVQTIGQPWRVPSTW